METVTPAPDQSPVNVVESPLHAAAPARQAPGRLKARADFVRVSKGARFHSTTFSLQAASRPPAQDTSSRAAAARFGFTVTKKVGGAVERNRIRRRLREVLRTTPGLAAQAKYDYVVVARREALTAPFSTLIGELTQALRRVHEPRRKPKRQPAGGPQAEPPGLAVRAVDLDALHSAPKSLHDKAEWAGSGIRDLEQ